MVKSIFFDFNGTLLDDLMLCFNIEESIMDRYKIKHVDLPFYLDNFCFPVKKYYERAGFDFNKISYKEVSETFMNEYVAREQKECKLYPGVKETLKTLKENGYKLYCYSASERKILNNQLKFYGIFDFFDGIIASDNIAAKGKLEYGKEYIEKNNIDVNTTLMLGDTAHDYEVATSLGLKPVLVSYGHNSEKLLKALNVPIINSFNDIIKTIKSL